MANPVRRLLGLSFLVVLLAAEREGATAAEAGGSVEAAMVGGTGGWCAHGHWHAAPVDSPDYRKFAPDRTVDILHLRLEVTPDFLGKSVSGEARLDFEPIRYPLPELRLDAVDLRVETVTSSHAIRAWHNDDSEIRVTFLEPVPAGQRAWVSVRYAATPARGLYFRTADMGYRSGDEHLFTQGETTEARHWYPSHDFPNEKFTTEILCWVPMEMTVLSNGRRLGEMVDAATGMKRVHWRTDKPHVNYLVSLVAGHFHTLETSHRGLPMAFHTAPSQFHMAERSLDGTVACMAYFEDEIGVPYPWEKYDQVCVQDFMWGGMENTSISTLSDRTLAVPELETLASSRDLMAHELAHQWFGDLVTCKDWAHVWLNEGFATYYTLLFKRHTEGRDAFLEDLWSTAENVLRLTPEGDSRAIVHREYDSDVQALMPGVWVYDKGAWVLHMLRSQLGEPAFREAVRRFLERHAHESVVTHDFIRVLEEVTGRSLDGFFDQWVFRRHFPHLEVEHAWDEALRMSRVTVRQTQPVSADIPLFRFPLTLRFKGDFGERDLRVEVSGRRQDFHIRLPGAPRIVRVDPDLELLARIRFEPPRAMVEAQVVDGEDVIGRLLAVKRLGSFRDARAVALLKERLTGDPFHGVRSAAAAALGGIPTDEALAALGAGRLQADARVRRAVVQELGRRPTPETRGWLGEMGGAEANPGVLGTVVAQWGAYAPEEVATWLEEALHRESFRDQVAAAAIRVLVAQGATEHLETLVRQLEATPMVYPMEGVTVRMNAVAHLARQAGETGSVRALLQARVLHPRLQVRTAALRALGELGDARATGFLEGWARHRETAVADAARSALARLRADRPLRVESADIRRELEGMKKEAESLRQELGRVSSRLEAVLREPVEPVPAAAPEDGAPE